MCLFFRYTFARPRRLLCQSISSTSCASSYPATGWKFPSLLLLFIFIPTIYKTELESQMQTAPISQLVSFQIPAQDPESLLGQCLEMAFRRDFRSQLHHSLRWSPWKTTPKLVLCVFTSQGRHNVRTSMFGRLKSSLKMLEYWIHGEITWRNTTLRSEGWGPRPKLFPHPR